MHRVVDPRKLDRYQSPVPGIKVKYLTKQCTRCKRRKRPVDGFSKDKSTKDGYNSVCKKCHRTLSRSHYEKRTLAYRDNNRAKRLACRKWIVEHKQNNPCQICGEDRWWVLEHHHIDPTTKSFSLSGGAGAKRSIKAIQQEIDKCIVICSNCHRDLHYKQRVNNA